MASGSATQKRRRRARFGVQFCKLRFAAGRFLCGDDCTRRLVLHPTLLQPMSRKERRRGDDCVEFLRENFFL
jgi:hypothetical protein